MKTVVPSFSGLWILLVEITKTRPLEKENVRLKRLLADEILGKELLKEALEKKL